MCIQVPCVYLLSAASTVIRNSNYHHHILEINKIIGAYLFNYFEQSLFGYFWDIDAIGNVPDRRSRILEVVIVRRLVTWVLGIWRGEGWERVEKGEVSLQAT